MSKKILVIAMANSIHVARWINMVNQPGWDIHLFPSTISPVIHENIRNVTLYQPVFGRHKTHPSIRRKGIYIPPISRYLSKIEDLSRFREFSYRARLLARTIDKLKPDLIHVIEMQHAGYLFLEAKKHLSGLLPPMILTNWGNDVYLFGRLKQHREKVQALIQAADYYDCECERDVQLARDLGLKGEVWPVFPNAGGLDLEAIAEYRQPGPTSGRRLILLKGYQNWTGRALFGLKAIELCADVLAEYTVGIYSAQEDVAIAAEVLTQDTGIPVEIIPRISHVDLLRKFGHARVYIGLNISDGVSTSMLEALAMGAFPIQSGTACADEWLVHGETGMIVPPDDPHEIAAALRQALVNDVLVDNAAEQNARVAAERLDSKKINAQSIALYEEVLNPI